MLYRFMQECGRASRNQVLGYSCDELLGWFLNLHCTMLAPDKSEYMPNYQGIQCACTFWCVSFIWGFVSVSDLIQPVYARQTLCH